MADTAVAAVAVVLAVDKGWTLVHHHHDYNCCCCTGPDFSCLHHHHPLERIREPSEKDYYWCNGRPKQFDESQHGYCAKVAWAVGRKLVVVGHISVEEVAAAAGGGADFAAGASGERLAAGWVRCVGSSDQSGQRLLLLLLLSALLHRDSVSR